MGLYARFVQQWQPNSYFQSSSPLKLSSFEVNSPCSTTPQWCSFYVFYNIQLTSPFIAVSHCELTIYVLAASPCQMASSRISLSKTDVFQVLDPKNDQPLVAVPPFPPFFRIPGTIFDAEQRSIALHQENHTAEVRSLQQAALLFLEANSRWPWLHWGLPNQKCVNKLMYVYRYIQEYTCTTVWTCIHTHVTIYIYICINIYIYNVYAMCIYVYGVLQHSSIQLTASNCFWDSAGCIVWGLSAFSDGIWSTRKRFGIGQSFGCGFHMISPAKNQQHCEPPRNVAGIGESFVSWVATSRAYRSMCVYIYIYIIYIYTYITSRFKGVPFQFQKLSFLRGAVSTPLSIHEDGAPEKHDFQSQTQGIFLTMVPQESKALPKTCALCFPKKCFSKQNVKFVCVCWRGAKPFFFPCLRQ